MMTRTMKILAGSAAVLAVGAVGQVAVYSQAPKTTTVHASWAFDPKSESQLRAQAKAIVLAEVVGVRRGADIVTQQSGEPDGVDRIPTRRVTVKVLESYKGTAKAGSLVTLFQTGGTVLPDAPAKGTKARTDVAQLVLEDDPAYRAGEQYLLMLEPGPSGTLRPVSPEGRYRYDKRTGALTATVKDDVAKSVAAQKLAALEPALRAGA